MKTIKPKVPLLVYQKYFEIRNMLESFLVKLEVITSSNAIVYSIRILIVAIALLMGYLQTTSQEDRTTQRSQSEVFENHQPVSPKQ